MSKRQDGGARAPSQRQLKVGESIRRALADVLARGDVHEPGLARVSVTVSEVRVSPDLRQATAYVMPLGGLHVEETLEALKRARGELRHEVTRSLTLKFSPSLDFKLDETFDRMDDMRRMLGQAAVRRDL